MGGSDLWGEMEGKVLSALIIWLAGDTGVMRFF